MDITPRLKKALNELAEMKAPSVEKILSSRDFRYEANRIKELVDAWNEVKIIPEQPGLAIHFIYKDESDSVLAQEGITVKVINFDVAEEQCPHCFREFALYADEGGDPEEVTAHLCQYCGFDTDWDGNEILAWLITGKKPEPKSAPNCSVCGKELAEEDIEFGECGTHFVSRLGDYMKGGG